MIPQDYFIRLEGVRDEYDAAAEALAFLARTWESSNSTIDKRIRLKDVKRASDNLEFTYFVRLHAEFESILRDDVQSGGGRIEDDPKVRVLEKQALTLRGKERKTVDRNSRLFDKLDLIHRHRNSIGHGTTPRSTVTLVEAMTAFNTFLSRL